MELLITYANEQLEHKNVNISFCQDTQQSIPYRYHGIDSTTTVLWMRILIP